MNAPLCLLPKGAQIALGVPMHGSEGPPELIGGTKGETQLQLVQGEMVGKLAGGAPPDLLKGLSLFPEGLSEHVGVWVLLCCWRGHGSTANALLEPFLVQLRLARICLLLACKWAPLDICFYHRP